MNHNIRAFTILCTFKKFIDNSLRNTEVWVAFINNIHEPFKLYLGGSSFT